MKNRSLYAILLIGVLVGAAPFSGNAGIADEKKMTKAEKRLERIEKKYQPTGVIKSSVSLRSLRDTRVIDDKTIFFQARGKKGYINRLPRRCPRLAYEQRFSYSTTIGQLCKSELITVLDSMGSGLVSCGLGKFEEWEKKPKTEKPKSE